EKGSKERVDSFVWDGTPQADYDSFDNWLLNVAVGPKNTFTYTDEDGVTHTVRNLDTKNPLREVVSGLFSGTIQLREEL
ncbi:MAG: hypothetical protein L7F78_22965, partial [Syntrophales bacterium LBB04]|nr:hypothetical protein [Syntrophales bacterium LBB04]